MGWTGATGNGRVPQHDGYSISRMPSRFLSCGIREPLGTDDISDDGESYAREVRWRRSSLDSAIRHFGFLVSDRKFINPLDDDTLPTHNFDELAEHFQNLNTPSTPHFFNTLYDPHAKGADFVPGYPHSLRA